MENLNNDLDKKHNYEVYTDKASKFLTFSIVLLALSLTSYLFALLVFDNFDFGFIFELFAFLPCISITLGTVCSIDSTGTYVDFIDFFVNINKTLHFFPM